MSCFGNLLLSLRSLSSSMILSCMHECLFKWHSVISTHYMFLICLICDYMSLYTLYIIICSLYSLYVSLYSTHNVSLVIFWLFCLWIDRCWITRCLPETWSSTLMSKWFFIVKMYSQSRLQLYANGWKTCLEQSRWKFITMIWFAKIKDMRRRVRSNTLCRSHF